MFGQWWPVISEWSVWGQCVVIGGQLPVVVCKGSKTQKCLDCTYSWLFQHYQMDFHSIVYHLQPHCLVSKVDICLKLISWETVDNSPFHLVQLEQLSK